jgi:hypothetical protein
MMEILSKLVKIKYFFVFYRQYCTFISFSVAFRYYSSDSISAIFHRKTYFPVYLLHESFFLGKYCKYNKETLHTTNRGCDSIEEYEIPERSRLLLENKDYKYVWTLWSKIIKDLKYWPKVFLGWPNLALPEFSLYILMGKHFETAVSKCFP